jgi:hypothetical protein
MGISYLTFSEIIALVCLSLDFSPVILFLVTGMCIILQALAQSLRVTPDAFRQQQLGVLLLQLSKPLLTLIHWTETDSKSVEWIWLWGYCSQRNPFLGLSYLLPHKSWHQLDAPSFPHTVIMSIINDLFPNTFINSTNNSEACFSSVLRACFWFSVMLLRGGCAASHLNSHVHNAAQSTEDSI